MLNPGRLFWKLFFGNVVLTAVVIALITWVIMTGLDRIYLREITEHLHAQATTLRETTAERFDVANAAALRQLLKGLWRSEYHAVRYTIILADGTVLADSEADAATMESYADRPEVREALARGWGSDTRLSRTVSRGTRYVAVRVGEAAAPRGVVRVAMPLHTIGERTWAAHEMIAGIALVGLAAAVALALGLARLWSRPIRRIAATARALSRGDLTARVRVVGNDELTMLARALNEMRDHLGTHLETIDRQRRTLESLLAQLAEGVVVTGPDGRIVLINPAAVRLLGLSPGAAGAAKVFESMVVEQCVRQHELQEMLVGAPGGTRPHETRLQIDGPNGPLSLLARATDIVLPMSPRAGGHLGRGESVSMGRLLVLTDITELTRLMQVKSDFAANASHELRTPLSAIRAAVETLLGVDPTSDPASLRHFLGVINRHSERMEAMVADLLDLSRIESSPGQFQPARLDLGEVVTDVRSCHEERIRAKRLTWNEDFDPSAVFVFASSYLLRLVLDNLVDNAIKFTDSGGIRIRTFAAPEHAESDRRIAIEVSDTGCGIPEEDQDRVFERFYQVERARSGALRGTGLGLSIVRHAVAAMQGTVALRSRLGAGTTVTVTLPQPPA